MHNFYDVFSLRNRQKIEDFARRHPPPKGIKLCYNELSGKGLFADRDFEAGEEIFRERCLVGLQVIHHRNRAHCIHGGNLCLCLMQHEQNRDKGVAVCQHCFRFLGPLAFQFMALLQAKGGENTESLTESLQKTGLPMNTALLGNDGAPPSYLTMPSPVPCRQECGDLYCSYECEQRSWHESGHKVLCVGGECEEAQEFSQHCTNSNELLRLAAQVVIITLNARPFQGRRVRTDEGCPDVEDVGNVDEHKDGGDSVVDGGVKVYEGSDVRDSGAEDGSAAGDTEGGSDVAAFEAAWESFATILKDEWRNVAKEDDVELADAPSAEDGVDDAGASLEESIGIIVRDSASLLRALLSARGLLGKPAVPPQSRRAKRRRRASGGGGGVPAPAWVTGGAEVLLSEKGLGSIMGMFELNNCAIAVPSPAAAYVRAALQLPAGPRREEVMRILRPILDQLRAPDYSSDSDGDSGPGPDSAAPMDTEGDGRSGGGCGGRGGAASKTEKPAGRAGSCGEANGAVREAAADGGEKVEGEGDGDLGDEDGDGWVDEALPGCEGTGLFRWQSCMNHACRPACIAFPPPRDAVDGDIVVRAAHPIKAPPHLPTHPCPLLT